MQWTSNAKSDALLYVLTSRYLHERVGNLVVEVLGRRLGAVAAVEGERDGLVRAAADLRQRLGRLGRQDRALVARLVHVHHVLSGVGKRTQVSMFLACLESNSD